MSKPISTSNAKPNSVPDPESLTARPSAKPGHDGDRGNRGSRNEAVSGAGGPDSVLRPSAPIIPGQSVAGSALVAVVAIMSFLACLALGAASVVYDAARDWQAAVSSEITIQIRPADGVDLLGEIDKAINIAERTPGVGSARVLSDAETQDLLAPWLGSDAEIASLPIPRLIVVEIDDPMALDLATLTARISTEVSGASVDDHAIWMSRLSGMASSMIAAAIAVVLLILAAMVLSIAFAVRAAIAGNKQIIDVLHFVGATDRFIAQEFQRHFLLTGLKGGSAGSIAAIAIFVVIGVIDRTGETPYGAQIDALVGNVSVGPGGYFGAVATVFIVAILTAVTSRIAVRQALRIRPL